MIENSWGLEFFFVGSLVQQQAYLTTRTSTPYIPERVDEPRQASGSGVVWSGVVVTIPTSGAALRERGIWSQIPSTYLTEYIGTLYHDGADVRAG